MRSEGNTRAYRTNLAPLAAHLPKCVAQRAKHPDRFPLERLLELAVNVENGLAWAVWDYRITVPTCRLGPAPRTTEISLLTLPLTAMAVGGTRPTTRAEDRLGRIERLLLFDSTGRCRPKGVLGNFLSV